MLLSDQQAQSEPGKTYIRPEGLHSQTEQEGGKRKEKNTLPTAPAQQSISYDKLHKVGTKKLVQNIVWLSPWQQVKHGMAIF